MHRYEIITEIGEGGQSQVFKARDTKTQTLVAIKKYRIFDEGIPSDLLREVSILKMVQHPNIVSLINVERRQGELWLVLEHMTSDLDDYLEKCKHKPLHPSLIQSYMYQILSGLAHCHKNSNYTPRSETCQLINR